jgi:hypothetical protein
MASISYSLIVLFIILGAGAVAVLGMAVHRLFSKNSNGTAQPQISDEQAKYMREVRTANVNAIYQNYRRTGYNGPNPNNHNNHNSHSRESGSMI